MTAIGESPAPGDAAVLDNAVWHALVGAHAPFARGVGRARRYSPDVSMFHAAQDDSPESWHDLAGLVGPGGTVALFRGLPSNPPEGWQVVGEGQGHQMVLTNPLGSPPPVAAVDEATGLPVTLRALYVGDVDAMVALVTVTEPGPFRSRTIELGGYVGVFHGDALVAMAGERMHAGAFREISAVCTHPEARRRGYASLVTTVVAEAILARGETPFLHVAEHNDSARTVYEGLGFSIRRMVRYLAARVTD